MKTLVTRNTKIASTAIKAKVETSKPWPINETSFAGENIEATKYVRTMAPSEIKIP